MTELPNAVAVIDSADDDDDCSSSSFAFADIPIAESVDEYSPAPIAAAAAAAADDPRQHPHPEPEDESTKSSESSSSSSSSSSKDVDVDGNYWLRVELAFSLRFLRSRATRELSSAVLTAGGGDDDDDDEENDDSRGRRGSCSSDRLRLLRENLVQLDDLLVSVEAALEEEEATGAAPSPDVDGGDAPRPRSRSRSPPIFVRLIQSYSLSRPEILALQFLILMKIQRSSCLRSLLQNTHSDSSDRPLPDDCSASLLRYACGLSQLDLSPLEDDSHPLVRDRVMESTEDDLLGSGYKFSSPDEVCRALVGGAELGAEDRLKLSGTTLLEILEEKGGEEDEGGGGATTGGDAEAGVAEGEAAKPKGPKSTMATIDKMLQKLGVGTADEDEGDVDVDGEGEGVGEGVGEGGSPDESYEEVDRDEVGPGAEGGEVALRAEADDEPMKEEDGEADEAEASSSSVPSEPLPTSAPDDREPRPYTCELEYLNDQFHLVMKRIERANHRHARELRDAAVETQPRWMRSGEGGSGKKTSVGELNAKLRLAERKVERSLELTRRGDKFYPRLEVLVGQLGLDDFEKSVVLYLCGSMISPIFKSSIANEPYHGSARKCTVGDLLLVFCDTVSEQVRARTYFYRSSKLVRKGLVRVCATYGASDLTDQELQLDRRVLDCIVGLDKESTEVVQGSHLYDPKVDMGTVVLPPGLKEGILNSVSNFDNFQWYRRNNPGIDEAIPYGTGLTLMFCGPSGTGKTMMANAVAAKVGKKLLLVDFPRLAQAERNGGSNDGGSSRFQSIFREAELSDAIIFFDECEMLFAKRDSGPSQVTELLTELERFDGIVFLATNRPFDLDEAMYRRISEVFEFKPPNHAERLDIWRLLTSHASVPCEEDIDWESVALRYEMTGGFIKNAVLAALLVAVGRANHPPPDGDGGGDPLVTESDIIDGCKKQMRGALQMRDFDERRVPSSGLDELIASDATREQLRGMVDLEKARGMLFGNWGFDDRMRERQGTTALFWGPPGTGRGLAAEAIGYELGKALKVVDFPQLLGRTGRANPTAVRDVFKEARLMDAVLVLSGLSVGRAADAASPGSADDSKLLNLAVREMTRFPGVVLMVVDTEDSLDFFVSRLERGLLDGIKFVVQFDLPDVRNREHLWRRHLPPSVPGRDGINFRSLAKQSERLNCAQIANVVYRAAASAALRPQAERRVTMEDFRAAISDERRRGETAVDRWAKSQYV